ncbi:MAG: hypothetical protein R2911_14160 [Caldilineaceae bacterium]
MDIAYQLQCSTFELDENMNNLELKFHPRETERVWIDIPTDTLESLKQIAEKWDMSVQALFKFYIGLELRQDLARQFGDRVLETTEKVLTRHLQSKEEIHSILREIRAETVK